MKFEKITENKIRITFNLDDLSENDIDFHSFMANSVETQELFLDMLEKAEREIGFITKNYKLMVEALATIDGNFVLTVTRSLPENIKLSSRKIRGKKKNPNAIQTLIYRFNDFDDICETCKNMDISIIKELNKSFILSRLYLYNKNYYLVLKYIKKNINIDKFICSISEFISNQKYSKSFEHRLCEYGTIIVKDKLFTKFKKYFG